MSTVDDYDEFASAAAKRKKKKKSLGILCESFIKQFLCWRSVISLEQAARRISDNKIEDSKLKTKVRRLYDIANVLAALNLIQKTSLDTRKPAFEWVGESGLYQFIEEMNEHFNNSPKDVKMSLNTSEVKDKLYERKSSDLNHFHNSNISSGYHRLNSGSTITTLKQSNSREDEELTFGNSALDFVKAQADVQAKEPTASSI